MSAGDSSGVVISAIGVMGVIGVVNVGGSERLLECPACWRCGGTRYGYLKKGWYG